MTDQEFLDLCIAVYERELARGRSKTQAHKAAEQFRRNFILATARASWERAQRRAMQ